MMLAEVNLADELSKINFWIYAKVATAVVIFGGITAFFKTVEEYLNKETKRDITRWLSNLKTDTVPAQWSRAFATIFLIIFGSKVFSLKCISRSFLQTFLVTNIILATVFFEYYAKGKQIEFITYNATGYCEIMSIALLCNAIPDYISLLFTREIVDLWADLERRQRILLFILQVFLCFTCGLIASVMSGYFTPIDNIIRLHHPGFWFRNFSGQMVQTDLDAKWTRACFQNRKRYSEVVLCLAGYLPLWGHGIFAHMQF
jgi:hypothetical protein